MEFDIGEQVRWRGQVAGEIPGYDNVIVGGMGGSALPARALFYLEPTYPVWLHNDYALPEKVTGSPLFIAISYSGNTSETLSFAESAIDKGHHVAAITSGGKLLELAASKNLPHIKVPEGLQPRDGVTYMLQALLTLLNKEDLLQPDVEPDDTLGEEIAKDLEGTLPLIYASRANNVLTYIWKVILNETAKIPAFANVFPELTHNEVQGIVGSENVKILLLKDDNDSNGVQHEMRVFEENASGHGLRLRVIDLHGSKSEKLLGTLATARRTAHRLAEIRGVDPDNVPFIEEFKKEL